MGALLEAQKKQADKVPPSFKTVGEWAEEEGWGEEKAKRVISGAVKAGIWEEKIFKIHTGSQLQSVKHFRPVPKK